MLPGLSAPTTAPALGQLILGLGSFERQEWIIGRLCGSLAGGRRRPRSSPCIGVLTFEQPRGSRASPSQTILRSARRYAPRPAHALAPATRGSPYRARPPLACDSARHAATTRRTSRGAASPRAAPSRGCSRRKAGSRAATRARDRAASYARSQRAPDRPEAACRGLRDPCMARRGVCAGCSWWTSPSKPAAKVFFTLMSHHHCADGSAYEEGPPRVSDLRRRAPECRTLGANWSNRRSGSCAFAAP